MVMKLVNNGPRITSPSSFERGTTSIQPLVTILINNYNYGRYLGEAIDSALNQTYPHIEVIVVDDGSTDDSRKVIERYGDAIVPIFKPNGGQASAFNAGFAASHGELICFLDADDLFLPNKVADVVEQFHHIRAEAQDILISHHLGIIDQHGKAGPRYPWNRLTEPDADYYEHARKYRYVPYAASTTSGIAISRSLAQRIFPLPEDYPSGADNFVVRTSALIGHVSWMDATLSHYRTHGANRFYGKVNPKPMSFWALEEQFLNSKLRENGRAPILDRSKSWEVRDYYLQNRRWTDLVKLSLSLPKHHLDSRTLKFFANTLLLTLVHAITSIPAR